MVADKSFSITAGLQGRGYKKKGLLCRNRPLIPAFLITGRKKGVKEPHAFTPEKEQTTPEVVFARLLDCLLPANGLLHLC